MSVYDNTPDPKPFFSEDNLIAAIKLAQHDRDNAHKIKFFDQIIEGKVDGQIKRCYFHMSKTESCGHSECHHPQYSPMPSQPYKVELLPIS